MSTQHNHDGHRNRMRNRYLETGFDSFQDHEILEMLLYNCYTRRNTNDIAHKLLEEFGSISAVLEAPVDSLVKSGISRNVAVYLHMIPDICRVYYDDRNNSNRKIIKHEYICDYFASKFIGRVDETIYLLLLDSKEKEIFCGVVSTGTTCTSDVPIRKIVDLSLRYNASYAIIAHNHPSGVALPSKEDVTVTKLLRSTLAAVGVRLIDHVIVADEESVSLRDTALSSVLFIGE
ncbi:MAG: DNA repair protein RadC [Ruminococcus sp.]|nr:DNA repair protein RadC [Ruminococcus sp.]